MLEALRDLFVLNWWNFKRSYFFMRLMRPVMIFLITLNSIFTRQRMSHENGLVVRGDVRLMDELDLPDNEFFKPGDTYKCRLRHASVSFLDDAALVVRSASLKFADAPIDSPFDMLMNNGTAAPFWNMDTFWQFMRAKMKGARAHYMDYFARNPRCYENVRDAVRLDPKSFSNLQYYSQIPLEFKGLDGLDRYAKFRLVPAHSTDPNDGKPGEDHLKTPWFQEPVSNETRSRNYLKDELRARLAHEDVEYRFQIQLLEWQDGHDRDIELNSLYPWDEELHPWRDLASVTITDTLDYHQGNLCLFSLRHLPPTLKVIPANGYCDGPSIDFLRLGGLWPRKARLFMYRLLGQIKPFPDERTETASDYADHSVSIVLSDDVYARPSLPQDDDEERGFERLQKLEVARGLYQYLHGFVRTEATRDGAPWDPNPFSQQCFEIYESSPTRPRTHPVPLPPFIRNLPSIEEYSIYIQGRLYKIIGASFLSLAMSWIEDWLRNIQGLKVYSHLCLGYRDKPLSRHNWRDDKEFARQRLAGLNPEMICLFAEIPEKFPITDEIVDGLLDPGETLESTMKAKRLYVCDYEILEGISVNEGRYLAHPIALFYANADGHLMPIAIQLFQSSEQGPIFTPKNDPGLWLEAKTFVQSADAQVHEVIEHLLHGHLIVEVFDVAMHRTLPDVHPVYKILMPHLEYTMAVNTSARSKMLAPGGPIDKTMAIGAKGAFELMGRAWWERWDFDRHHIPGNIEARGVGDDEALPSYYWRDDALALWGAIEHYVTEMIAHFYPSDTHVAEDWEIQAFHKELREGVGGNVRALPGGEKGFADKTTLVEVLTRLIYASSAGHAAVNNGQYDYYGFIPNTPGAMYAPAPTKTSETRTDQDLVNALPRLKAASIQILMVRLLSRPTEMPIGKFHTSFFAGTNDVWPIINRFRMDLHQISERIQARNKELTVPYTYLDPVQVACSITA